MTLLLTPIELDFLWEARHAGEVPYPLEIQSHGATDDERAVLRRQVIANLRERGMIDHGGRLEPQLEDWLGVLGSPMQSIDSVFLPSLDAPPVRALAAASRGTALLVTQDSRGLVFHKIDPSGLISAIVEMLPPAPRGTELSISLPAEEFAMAGGRGSDDQTREALNRLTSLPNQRGGQIAANARTDLGARRRSTVLAWFDNESGRYLGQMQRARDGRDWTTVAPADTATLRKRISEMLTSVTADDR
jgi:hypothetical protein